MKKREVPAPLALPEELEIRKIEMVDDGFVITAHCTQNIPAVPSVEPLHNGSIALISAELRTFPPAESACACGFWCADDTIPHCV